VVPALVDAALAGRPLPIHGDGLQSRDFTFVDTVAATLLDAVRRRVSSPTPVNLALGTRTTLLELVAELERAFGRPLAVAHGPDRPGDVRNSQADSTRLRELFPDVVAVPLADGLRATISWMSAQLPALAR
jgi:UDP-glucose 4-epimerase